MYCSPQTPILEEGIFLSDNFLIFKNQLVKIPIWMWDFCGGLEREHIRQGGNHSSIPYSASFLIAL